MLASPTSADIRRCRLEAIRVWSKTLSVLHGPALVSVGATGTALRVLAGPVEPALRRLGSGFAIEILDAATPAIDHQLTSGSTAASGLSSPLAGESPWQKDSNRPPAQMRSGLYGEMAWRGWQIAHRLRTQPTIAHALHRWAILVECSNRMVERCADEMHDGTEQALGTISWGAHRTRTRLSDAATSTAQALRRTG